MTILAAGRHRGRPYWRTRGIIAAALCATSVGVSIGVITPLVAVKLEEMSGSGLVIGANAVMAALSTVLATPFIPGLFTRFDPRRFIAAASLIGAAAVAAFSLTGDVAAWFALRLLYGLTITVVFVGSEAWINQLAPPAARARVLGLYAAVLAGGFGAGAGLFAFIGAQGELGFFIGAAFTALAAVAVIIPAPRLRPPRTAEDAGPASLWRIARLAPIPIAAAFAFGAIDLAALNFLPIYALRQGFGESGAGALLIAIALGNILLQAPIGWLADRLGRRRILDVCAWVGVLAPAAVALAGASLPAASLVVFVYGGVVVAMYAVGLATLAQSTSPSQLTSANAAFIFAYGVGSLASPPIAGAAIDALDPYGVLIVLSGFAALYLVIAALSRR